MKGSELERPLNLLSTGAVGIAAPSVDEAWKVSPLEIGFDSMLDWLKFRGARAKRWPRSGLIQRNTIH